MEKRRVRLYKAQEDDQPSVDQLGYPGAQSQQQGEASGEEQLMQIIYQDISNDVPEGAIVTKLVNGYNLDPATANQYLQRVYAILQNKIDEDVPEEEDNSEEEVQEKVENEVLNENKPMSKIQGHTDLAMDDEEIDVTDLGDEDMMRYGGTPRFDYGGEQDPYLAAMNTDRNYWGSTTNPIVFPEVSEYLPSGLESYLANNSDDIVYGGPQTDEDESQYSEDYVDPEEDVQEEFRMGGFKTKKGYVNSVMKLVKKAMGGDEKEQDIKASDADPRGEDLRKNRLDAFIGSIKKEGNATIAKEEAEKAYDQMQAMHQQMMMQGTPLQNFIPEDYEGMDYEDENYMQFGGQQRRAMRRMRRALRHIPGGIPGVMGPITKFDVHRTGIFGGPKEYTIEFGDSPLMQLANNPFLSQSYGYGYKSKTIKTPGRLITEKVRNTVNNKSTKDIADATGSEAANKSAWDLDQNSIPDSIQSNIIESKIKNRTPGFITDPIGTAVKASKEATPIVKAPVSNANVPGFITDPIGTAVTASKQAQPSVTPQVNSVEDIFKKNPPKVGETNSAYLLRTTGNPGFYNNTDLWDGTQFVKTKDSKIKEEGGIIDNPMPDQFGNLQRFIGGGFDPSIADLNQNDIDFTDSKDTSDPYLPQARFGRFFGAMMRNYFPANMPQRYAYSQMMGPAYNKATGQQFANIPGYNPNAQIKDIQVTKKGIFGQPKRYTVTYNNNPSGKPGDRRLASVNPATASKDLGAIGAKAASLAGTKTAASTMQAADKVKQDLPKTKLEQQGFQAKTEQTDLRNRTERKLDRAQRRTDRQVARGEEDPEGNVPFMFNNPGKSSGDNLGLGTRMRMLGAKLSGADRMEYGGDLQRFIPQALLGNETPVSMENNPANSKISLPTKTSKEVGQQLMMDSRKKLEDEATYEPDEYSVDYKAKKKRLGDRQGLILSTYGAAEGLAGFVDRWKNRNNDVDVYNNTMADNVFARDPSTDSGDHDLNSGLYRPNAQGNVHTSRSAKYGGNANYYEGDEVEMTEEELAEFLANGGQVEYL